MTEKELNDAIDALDAEFIGLGNDKFPTPWAGKPIPYIGWYWRYVHFDSEKWVHTLGVIPSPAEGQGRHLVAFMENNKWGYPLFRVPDQHWHVLRAVIVGCVTIPTADTCQAVFDKLQSLLPPIYQEICDHWTSPYA